MITAEQTLVGKLNLDVEYVYPDLQEKSVKPKTEAQTVVPDEGYYGLSEVTVDAVTSDIDSNIKPENIVKGIDILGVEGTAAFPTLGTKTITEDGTYKASDDDLGGYSEVDVDVGSSYFNTSPSANTTLIRTITKMPLIDTSKYTSMDSMFYNCLSLTTISQLDTSKVTNMWNMFRDCTSLVTIPQLNTSAVTNMTGMFGGCSSLTAIPQLNTGKVTDMSYMFSNCKNLKTIPLLDTGSVTNMYQMFPGCNSLETIPELNTGKVIDMGYMFSGCENLKTIPLLDTGSVTNMNYMFQSCDKIIFSLDNIKHFNTKNVTDMSGMFAVLNAPDDTSYVLNFNTPNVTNFSGMFRSCHGNLVSMPNISFSKAIYINDMFGYISGTIKLNDHHNLGEAYLTSASANYSNYQLNISRFTNTPKENLVEIINGLYDIKSAGVKAQRLILGSTNLAKLTSDEINVAVQKGWTVS